MAPRPAVQVDLEISVFFGDAVRLGCFQIAGREVEDVIEDVGEAVADLGRGLCGEVRGTERTEFEGEHPEL